MQAPGRNALLIHLLILALYTLFACLLGHLLPFFFTYFPCLPTSLLNFSFKNGPALFSGQRLQEATKPGKFFGVMFLMHDYFAL